MKTCRAVPNFKDHFVDDDIKLSDKVSGSDMRSGIILCRFDSSCLRSDGFLCERLTSCPRKIEYIFKANCHP